jgi:hypothetical protein
MQFHYLHGSTNTYFRFLYKTEYNLNKCRSYTMTEASSLIRGMDTGLYLSFTVLLPCIGGPNLRQTRSTECLIVQADSSRRLGFEHRSCHVGFVVGKVALGKVFSKYIGFPCQFSFH